MLRRYHGISIAKSMLVLTLSSKMWICYSCVNGAWLGKAQGQERQPLMVHVSLSPKRPVTSSDGLFLSTLASARILQTLAVCRTGPAASVISFSSWDLDLNRGPPDESQRLGNG